MSYKRPAMSVRVIFMVVFVGSCLALLAKLTGFTVSLNWNWSSLYQSGRLISFMIKKFYIRLLSFPGSSSWPLFTSNFDRYWTILVPLVGGLASHMQHVKTFVLDMCCACVEVPDFTTSHRSILHWVTEHGLLEEFSSLIIVENHGPQFTNQTSLGNDEGKLRYEPGFGALLAVSYQGQRLWIKRVRQSGRDGWTTKTIVVYCMSRKTTLIRHFISECEENLEMRLNSYLRVCLPEPSHVRQAGYNQWLPPELHLKVSVDDLVLEPSLLENILERVARLLQRPEYIRVAGGLLFLGPPGTGKSTTAEAMASKHNLTIRRISLSDPTLTEEGLNNLVRNLDGSLLLIEDVDPRYLTADKSIMQTRIAAHVKTGGITGPGLLQIFDAIAKLKRVLVIITANFVGKVHGPLMRAGRIDNTVIFKNPDRALTARFFTKICSAQGGATEEMANEFASALPAGKWSFADIQQYLLEKGRDANLAVRDVKQLCEPI